MAHHTEQYDSVGDWLDYLESFKAKIGTSQFYRPDHANDSAFHDNGIFADSSWSGAATWHETIDLARHGWPDGRAKIATAHAGAVAYTAPITHRAIGLDVAGMYPVVPEFIAGNPACMRTLSDEDRASRPVVRLVCEQWVSGYVKACQQINRGAAIAAHVDRLESAGFRCEIVARFGSTSSGRQRGQHTCAIDIMVKRADSPLDLDKLVFMMAHPAALRRLFFAHYEAFPDPSPYFPGHGRPAEGKARQVEPDQILVASANEDNSKYNAIEAATAHVGKIISDGLEVTHNMRCDGLRGGM